jgi:hypothetical protein
VKITNIVGLTYRADYSDLLYLLFETIIKTLIKSLKKPAGLQYILIWFESGCNEGFDKVLIRF